MSTKSKTKSKIYCGIGDVPKKKKRGSAEQCIEKNQIRYWGVKKISKSLIKDKAFVALVSKKKLDDMQLKVKAKEIEIKTLFKKYKAMPETNKKEKKEKKKLGKKIKGMLVDYRAKKKKYDELRKKAGK